MLGLLGQLASAAAENPLVAVVTALIGLTVVFAARRLLSRPGEVVDLSIIGPMTPEHLGIHDGRDDFRPLLVAVRGTVYEVPKDIYGPEGAWSAAAGREIALALALLGANAKEGEGALDTAAISEDGEEGPSLKELSEEQTRALAVWEKRLKKRYHAVGTVEPPLALSLEELKTYDGTDAKKPILLAIKGRIFDVTRGKAFYGPDGVYPFAGREVARALAKMSTEDADCCDDLSGLQPSQLDTLREWENKFAFKYKIAGRVVSPTGK